MPLLLLAFISLNIFIYLKERRNTFVTLKKMAIDDKKTILQYEKENLDYVVFPFMPH